MKILVVDLLRLGDLFMHRPVVAALKRRYPGAEIHMLLNEEFKGAHSLLKADVQWYFPRGLLQEMMARSDIPIHLASDCLSEFVDELNLQGFSQVVNLTQNRLSAWICGLLDVGEKTGLRFNTFGQIEFGDPWIRHMNDYVALGGTCYFHYNDIFMRALGLDLEPHRGRENTHPGEDPQILLQILSSEEKKNWSVGELRVALDHILVKKPKARFKLLGAPFEKETLVGVLKELEPLPIELAITSLSEVAELLASSHLLITVDTSIKHLAANSSCPVLELSLGSSDPRRMGVFKSGSFVMESGVFCAPCPHRAPCSRDRFYCRESLKGEPVAQEALKMIEHENPGSAALVFKDSLGYWTMGRQEDPVTLEFLVERFAWHHVLSQSAYWGQQGSLARMAVEALGAHPQRGWKSIFQDKAKKNQELLSLVARAQEVPDWLSPDSRAINQLVRDYLPPKGSMDLGVRRRYQMGLDLLKRKIEFESKISDQVVSVLGEAKL